MRAAGLPRSDRRHRRLRGHAGQELRHAVDRAAPVIEHPCIPRADVHEARPQFERDVHAGTRRGAASSTASSASASSAAACTSSGGSPRRSANSGDAPGVRGLRRPGTRAMARSTSPSITGSGGRLKALDGRLQLRSTQGDRQTAAAGIGRPASRSATRVATTRPPPAESPASTRRSGLARPLSSNQRTAATASSRAAG